MCSLPDPEINIYESVILQIQQGNGRSKYLYIKDIVVIETYEYYIKLLLVNGHYIDLNFYMNEYGLKNKNDARDKIFEAWKKLRA